jgi:cytochrome c oxidase cbb3-type subunit 3
VNKIKIVAISIAVAAFIFACEREECGFRVKTPDANRINSQELSGGFQAGNPAPTPAMINEYENNAYALSEGKHLFESMNCTGCHAHGGGAIGPPLMDAKWIYGSQPDQIFSTIVQGRPNGMPAFHGKLPDYQVWQLTAYVRSLSGQAKKDAATSRDDDIQMKTPENSVETQSPKNSTLPKSAEAPQ